MNSIIYDFETLSSNPRNGVILSFALFSFDEQRFVDNPYTFDEILESSIFQKYDVTEQVQKYKRKISQETVDWWLTQDIQSIKNQFNPKSDDISISQLCVLIDGLGNINKAFSRGRFDSEFIDSIYSSMGKINPIQYWKVRDIRSYLDGMMFGVKGFNDKFIPKELSNIKFAHDPKYDIALDVIRIQTCVNLLL